jgi:hypothetical protein
MPSIFHLAPSLSLMIPRANKAFKEYKGRSLYNIYDDEAKSSHREATYMYPFISMSRSTADRVSRTVLMTSSSSIVNFFDGIIP